jgi:ubiquinone/menaquinone biosynthesis C-methylase UbiE
MIRTLLTRPWIFELGASFYAWFTAQETWRASCARLVSHFPAPRAAGKPLLVLDLGCGPGVTVIEMARVRPEAQIIGLDLAPRMLDNARRYTAATEVGNQIDYVLADATHLPFSGDSIDVITGHSFLYLVGNRTGVLSEAYRVLRAGGRYASMEPHGGGADWRAVIRDYGRHLRMMTAIVLWRPFSLLHGQLRTANFKGLLEAAGFQKFRSETVLNGLGIIGEGEKP